MYTLWEYAFRNGPNDRGHEIGSAFCVEDLPWDMILDDNDYTVLLDGIGIANFNGIDTSKVLMWLVDHPCYEGEDGCDFWKGSTG